MHELRGAYPQPDGVAPRAVAAAMRRVPNGALVVLDGLGLAAAPVALRAERRRIRAVALVHHPAALETGWPGATARSLARAERAALRHTRHAIVTSAHTGRLLVADYGVTRTRVAVVLPGVDLPDQPRRYAGRAPPQLICVGAVVPRKGHLTLVEALAHVADRPWRLTCYGSLDRDPDLVVALRRRIAEYGLAERTTLAGAVDDATLQAAFADAEVLVHPAYYEGYGMVLAEAIAHGLPIVATGGGAVPETVPAGAGILVAPGDPMALAQALAGVLDNPIARAALARRALAARDRLPRWPDAVRAFAAALERVRHER